MTTSETAEKPEVSLLQTILSDSSLMQRLESMPTDEKTIAVTADGGTAHFSHPDLNNADLDHDQIETLVWTEPTQSAGPSQDESSVPQRKVASFSDGKVADAEYRLIGQLGSGGTAFVYQAHQRAVDREVAVKVLRDELASDPKSRQRFLTEARLIGGLDHPNVIALHEVGLDDQGKLFYSMKRIDGTSWDQQISELSLQQNVSTLLRVADAIRYAHSRGLIHRDIKPENIMLGRFGEVLVADWGLAVSRRAEDADLQLDGTIGGTPAYMAPELAIGDQSAISYPTDVYLLGAILFQILTGHPPHHGSSLLECIRAAATNQIRPSRVEGELMDIAMKAMSMAPEDRYQTVDELIDVINGQRQHEESERLVKRARWLLHESPSDGQIEDFRIADALLREAMEIWPENRRAQEAIVELNIEFARAATAKGDLELALTLYEAADQSDSEAAARIRRELERRKTAGQQVARYSALFTQLPEAGLMGSITTGEVVEANEMFGRMFGYGQEEIVGKRMDELGLWVCEHQRLEFVTAIKSQGRVDNFEARLKHVAGAQMDVLISARHTTINGEEMVVSTLRNISELKEAQRQLEKNRRRLADMQKLAGLGTWMYDVPTRQVHWSDEAFRLAGREVDQGIPSRREYLQQIHPEDRRSLIQAIRHAIENVASFEIRVRQRRQGADDQHLIIRGQPIQDDSGRTVEVYGVLIPTKSC